MYDQEIIDDLTNQIKDFIRPLNAIIEKIEKEIMSPQLFEEFGQIVDRIYGVVAMINLPEFSHYIHIIKEIAYKTSRSENEEAYKKVFELLKNCINYLLTLIEGLSDTQKLNSIKLSVKVDQKKAETITRSYLFSIKDASVNTENLNEHLLIFDRSKDLEFSYKEANKVFFPMPEFANQVAGFYKRLNDPSVNIKAVYIDTTDVEDEWKTLIEQVKEKLGKVTLVVASKNILKAEEIRQFGIDLCLKKQRDFNKLFNEVKKVSKENEKKWKEEAEQCDFRAIAGSVLNKMKTINLDIYLQNSSKQMQKVIEKGQAVDSSYIQSLLQEELSHFFILNRDFSYYESLCKDKLNTPIESTDDTFDLGQEIYSFLSFKSVNDSYIKTAKDYISSSLNLLDRVKSEHQDIFHILEKAKNHHHSIGNAFFVALFLSELGADTQMKELFTLTAFLHDVGLEEQYYFNEFKELKDFTQEEKRIFERHCVRGVEILRKCQFSSSILEAIKDHHYPLTSKKKEDVNMLAQLINISEFILLQFKLGKLPAKWPELAPTLNENYSQPILKALDKIFL